MKRIAFLAVLAVAATPAAAAAVTVDAELSRTQVALGDRFTLTVTVNGASLSSIRLPAMDAFNVYDSEQAHSVNFINGRMSSSSVFTYVLSPRQAGKFKIPPISVDGADPTPALDVEVLSAGQSPAAPAQSPATAVAPAAVAPAPRPGRSRDILITATLDKPRVYVNQQATLTIRFLNGIPLIGNIGYNPPALTGFLVEDLPAGAGNTQVDGRPYQYHEIKLALFPLQPGKLKIGSAAVQCMVPPRAGGTSMQDVFNSFLAMASPEPVTVNTEPLTLQVDPLPAGKPENFTGVVGKLSARAAADRTRVKAGDAVNLSVSVSGIGNVKSVPEPKKPDLPTLRFFETESSSVVEKKKDVVGGSKIFKTVVVPRVSGKALVPSYSFSYFDPETKSYALARTEALTLDVAPGAPDAAPAPAAAPTAPGLTAYGDDIRYLKTSPARAPVSEALAAFADLGPWHAFPFAAFLGAVLLAWRRRAADSDPRGRRFRDALARADARLKEAAALPAAEGARSAALIGEALTGFVADKLDAPAAGLSLKSALDGLKALRHPPSDATLGKLRAAWEEADLRRFAPGAAGDDAGRFARTTFELLETMDAEVRR